MGFTLLRDGGQEPAASCDGSLLPGSSIVPPTRNVKAKAQGKGSSSSVPPRHGRSVMNPPPVAPPPGRMQMYRVGPPTFQTLEEIGKGSFGVVLKAKDLKTGDIVAIKKIRLDDRMSCLLADKGLSHLPEVNLHASCGRHHAIVRMREVFLNHHTVFIVMDCIPKNLRLLLRSEPWLFHERGGVRKIMAQLLSGIAYIHRKGIIHCDIKPDNILMTRKREPKICDFGAARTFRHGSLSPPPPHPIGTLPYCAPEMLAGKEYSETIDVWSAGCLMAELLTRTVLCRGKDIAEQLDLIHKIMAVDRLHQEGGLRGRIPLTLLSSQGFDLLTSLLAVDPHKRITAEKALSHPWFF